MTNADKVRQMSDEELASFSICGEVTMAQKDYKCPDVDSCFECKIAWLKQEVTE